MDPIRKLTQVAQAEGWTMSVRVNNQALPTQVEKTIWVYPGRRSSWVNLTKVQDKSTLAKGWDKLIMIEIRDKSPLVKIQDVLVRIESWVE